MKYDGRLYTQAEVDAMNNTPKTVESFRELLALYGDICAQHQSTLHFGRFTVDERNLAIRKSIDELSLITALNELKSELTKQQVVSALQQTALDHIVGGDYEDLLTKNLNAELRAEERLQK